MKLTLKQKNFLSLLETAVGAAVFIGTIIAGLIVKGKLSFKLASDTKFIRFEDNYLNIAFVGMVLAICGICLQLSCRKSRILCETADKLLNNAGCVMSVMAVSSDTATVFVEAGEIGAGERADVLLKNKIISAEILSIKTHDGKETAVYKDSAEIKLSCGVKKLRTGDKIIVPRA